MGHILSFIIKYKKNIKAIILASLFCGSIIFISGGKTLDYVTFSPDRTYMLAHFKANRFQRMIHLGMTNPMTIELHCVRIRCPVKQSKVIDFVDEDGKVFWHMEDDGTVMVSDAYFENVPPINPVTGEILPIPNRPRTGIVVSG